MPRYYRRRFRSRRSRRPRTAAKKVVRYARRRRSSKAQSRQIVRLARSISHINNELKEDELHASYRLDTTFRVIPSAQTISPPQPRHGIVVVPLTSGPSQIAPADPDYYSATGDFLTPDSVTGADALQFGNCKWNTWVRPRNASQMNWIKLYKQTVKLRFDADTMDSPITYTVFLMRVARTDHGKTNTDNTVMQLAQRIDGVKFLGNNGLSPDTGFQRNNDFTSSVALAYTAKQGQSLGNNWDTDNNRSDGVPLGAGNDVMFNSNMYDVISKRTFTLGPTPNPLYSEASATTTVATQSSGLIPRSNNMSHTISFSINYGGAKLSAVDGSGPSAIDQVQDIAYSQINPKLKHWLVICPNVSAPVSNAVCSLNSVISCKVPA